MTIKIKYIFILLFVSVQFALCQFKWTENGEAYYALHDNNILLLKADVPDTTIVVSSDLLIPNNAENPLQIQTFTIFDKGNKVLIFTNTKRVWRYETKGDYYILDIKTKELRQLGNDLNPSSLMFAKISPDGQNAAYVSENNIYVENVLNGVSKKLTETKGLRKLINGTFDWVYEEEFDCRDGFRWSPDSKSIAYWQIDANEIRDFYMINTTDSIYPQIIPVEYPKVGEHPAACRLGIVDIASAKTKWIDVPGDERNNYIPRMDWHPSGKDIVYQQLNRKQNTSNLYKANVKSGTSSLIYKETDPAWISLRVAWKDNNLWKWLEDKKTFLWITEKDGWRHVYRMDERGKETLITKGNYDIISPMYVDEKNDRFYFTASPDNATESYLYMTSLSGKEGAKRLTPSEIKGTNRYTISGDGTKAMHSFSNYYSSSGLDWISLPDHTLLRSSSSLSNKLENKKKSESNIEFFTVTTEDGIEMDGWMAMPENFDSSLKYPIVFYVYGEPWGATVKNRSGTGRNGMYNGNMAKDGYIYASIDGRGTPYPKGREWRKSIYKKIGVINIRDQAMGCKKLLEERPYIDPDRVAVHGWSGGGATTLNLLFQYPELYQTGIAVAAVTNQLTYDNVYQERYMGLKSENEEDFLQGSPITHAKNLEGNLLYIHGTADDNVHYQNAELLVNELIKHNKQFQFMPYPNRAHGIWRGDGTRQHLNTLFTNFLKTNCPPGGLPRE